VFFEEGSRLVLCVALSTSKPTILVISRYFSFRWLLKNRFQRIIRLGGHEAPVLPCSYSDKVAFDIGVV